ncbi:MAG: hypothetical protein AAB792_01860 [Patescibacteria group bacterium]
MPSHLLAWFAAHCGKPHAPPFNSPAQAKQLACSSPHPKIRLVSGFLSVEMGRVELPSGK